jgi:hypothetical protein
MPSFQHEIIDIGNDELLFEEKDWIGRGKKYDWTNLPGMSHRQKTHPLRYYINLSIEHNNLRQIYQLPISSRPFLSAESANPDKIMLKNTQIRQPGQNFQNLR